MLGKVTLDDKFEVERGRIIMSGVQALTRLPMVQRIQDQGAGLNTRGFISGYQGSPITAYDLTLTRAKQQLDRYGIRFVPAVNEELAATACWGSQQIGNFKKSDVDGVFAIWYGKGPGVDRASDAIKHGNQSGTHPHGGVLAIFGDDHGAKSSTVAHNSEPAMAAMSVPVVYPASLEEYFQFGLFGWGMSRYSGLWTGFKTVPESIEQTATIDINFASLRPVVPEGGVFPPEGVHYDPAYTPARDDVNVTRYKLPLVHLFARANRIDRSFLVRGKRRLGIITAGKSYLDVLQALKLLGIGADRREELGISIYKLGLIWPIEPEALLSFARDHEEILVLEEKKPFLELQVARILYPLSNRPRLIGKQEENGQTIFPSDISIDPVMIAVAVGDRLASLGIASEALASAVSDMRARLSRRDQAHASYVRSAFYCSGCPHNTSTKLPEGSQGMGGIGCHGMATFTRTDTHGVTQMGGEGATWIGAAPFVATEHVFQNLGDGTYYHSGVLAIRAAVAAGINITYKILYNDATGMTGGQPLAGPMSVGDVTRQVAAEGVNRVVVVTDRPELYGPDSQLAPGCEVHHRDKLIDIQSQMRTISGVTVIVYEQTCASEKRRRRKRNAFPDPPKRMFINAAVCEGCGDCSVQSNCVSLFPVDTIEGRKRKVDQSTCNKDYSCVRGFCPSFVTVRGGSIRKPDSAKVDKTLFEGIPEVAPDQSAAAVMVAGIGGTGVVTVGAVLTMAAHLEGKYASSYDATGMAQKGGAVYSHIRIVSDRASLAAAKICAGEADLLLACDLVAAASADGFSSIRPERTSVIGNSTLVPTAESTKNVDTVLSSRLLRERLAKHAPTALFPEAGRISEALVGDTIGANFFLVGVAQQSGLLPLRAQAIEAAIELNGVSVGMNHTAFRLGRLWVHDRSALESLISTEDPSPAERTTAELRAHFTNLLTDYQDARYAIRYNTLVDRVATIEANRCTGTDLLTRAVVLNLAKLMAYKDEYEVARLYTSSAFQQALREQFSGNFTLGFNLAPPLLAKRDRRTRQLQKSEYGAWVFQVFKLLARIRGLRGTAFDVFGYTAERKTERAWIKRYEQMVEQICVSLHPNNHAIAVRLASVPEGIRGYGHIKERSWQAAERAIEELTSALREPIRATKEMIRA